MYSSFPHSSRIVEYLEPARNGNLESYYRSPQKRITIHHAFVCRNEKKTRSEREREGEYACTYTYEFV